MSVMPNDAGHAGDVAFLLCKSKRKDSNLDKGLLVESKHAKKCHSLSSALTFSCPEEAEMCRGLELM